MKKINLNKIISFLSELSYLAIIFFTPLYFAVFLKNNDIFELNKIVFFKVLVLLLLLFTFFRFLLFFNKKIKLQKGLSLVILFLIFSYLASTFFSINLNLSLSGVYSRFQGLEVYLYYVAFFILILWYFFLLPDLKEKKRKIIRIIWTASLSAFLVSIYAVAQRFGYDFFTWSEPAFLTNRATSSLGQPNFLASWLLLTFSFSFYLFFCYKKFLIRFFVFLIIFFQILALIFTGSRAGYMGFVFGVMLVFLSYLFFYLKRKKIIIGSILFLSILFLLVFTFGANTYLVKRLKNITDISSGSVAARINFWEASLELIPDKIWFGYGLDTQSEIFALEYKKDWAIYGNVNVYPSRAHNIVLDILLTQGIFGLAVFIVFLFYIYRFIILNLKKNKEYNIFLWTASGSLSAYLFSLLFGFATVATNIYFWLIIALVLLSIDHNLFLAKDKEREAKKYFIILKILILVFLSGAVLYQAQNEFKYLKADHYYKKIIEARMNNNYAEAIELYSYIQAENLQHNYYENKFALLMSDWVLELENSDIRKILGRNFLEKILLNLENNYSDAYLKAKIYIALDKREAAEKNILELINLSPEMPRTYRLAGDFYFRIDNYEQAKKYYLKAFAYFPEENDPYLNSQHLDVIQREKSIIYKSLGDLYFAQELYLESRWYYDFALQKNSNNILLYRKIADTYYKEGNLEQAIFYNQRGFLRNSDDYTWPLALAMLYQENDNLELAKEYIQKAKDLAPQNESVVSIYNNLIN